MAGPDRDAPEGWGVPTRIGIAAGVLVPLMLAIGVVAGGAVYNHTLRPRVRFTVTPQPAPGLMADIHAGVTDPEPPPPLVRPDPAIVRAKAEVAAEGIAGWSGGGR